MRYSSNKALIIFVCPSIWGWLVVENFNSEPKSLNSSTQNWPVYRASQSLTMSQGNQKCFTTWLKNSLVASSAGHASGAGINTEYLENLSTITKIDLKSQTFGNLVMKSMEMLSQGFFGMGRGCNNTTAFFITPSLTCGLSLP